MGPDGRLWLGITGSAGFPRTLPASGRVAMNGIHLRSFDGSGAPVGEESVLPGLRSYAELPAVGFGPGGRLASASLNAYLPATPGSVDVKDATSMSVVVFDLTDRAAPALSKDREIFLFNEIIFGSATHSVERTVAISSTDGQALRFVAAVVPDGDRGIPPPGIRAVPLTTAESLGILPASFHFARVPDSSSSSAVLVALVPGAQGTVVMPLRVQSYRASLQTRILDSVALPGTSAMPLRAKLRVEVATPAPLNMSLNVPFQIESNVPWLRPERREGTTPDEITLLIDPAGLPSGVHNATVQITAAGLTDLRTIPLTIGPLAVTEGLPLQINVPSRQPLTHSFRLLSSSAPFDFTIEARDSWMQVSPASGTTPQDISVTFTPTAGMTEGQTVFGTLLLRIGDRVSALVVRYVITSGQLTVLPDNLYPTELAPGSLLNYQAGTSRCDAPQSAAVPWPESLGRCTLRVNGRAVPLSGIGVGTASGATGVIFQQIHGLGAQLPYDLPAGPAEVELEDRDGRKTRLPIRVVPVAPILVGIAGVGILETPLRRTGEELTLKLSGMGKMNREAPLGNIAKESLAPLTAFEVFVGGRKARLITAELSRSEVGIVEMRVEVPSIAPDLHLLSVRVAGIDLTAGSLKVTN